MSPLRRATVALLVLLPILPACEGPRLIAGRVRDGAGNPVPRALLRTSDDIADVSEAETDSAGRFSFSVFANEAPVPVPAPAYRLPALHALLTPLRRLVRALRGGGGDPLPAAIAFA